MEDVAVFGQILRLDDGHAKRNGGLLLDDQTKSTITDYQLLPMLFLLGYLAHIIVNNSKVIFVAR